MKTKKSFLSRTILEVIPVITVTLLVFMALSSCAAKKKAVTVQSVTSEKPASTGQEVPYVVVEEMPMFPGGDSTLLAYISLNTKYPEAAKNKKIQGKVIVRFCVTAVGSIDRIIVLKGINPELDAEAARVVSSLPAFKPGKQGGKPVPVWYMVPINFSLN
jgi:periplasmic protein TonB